MCYLSAMLLSLQRLHGAVIHGSPRPFAPQERTPEGHVMLIDFLLHLCDEVTIVMGRLP